MKSIRRFYCQISARTWRRAGGCSILIKIVLAALVDDLVADGEAAEIALHGLIVVVDAVRSLEAHRFALEPAFEALIVYVLHRAGAVADVEEWVRAGVPRFEADSAGLLRQADSTLGHAVEHEVRLLHQVRLLHAGHPTLLHVGVLVLSVKAAVLQHVLAVTDLRMHAVLMHLILNVLHGINAV